MTNAELQHALLGGIVVRNAVKRLRAVVNESTFTSKSDRAVYVYAVNLTACGLEGEDLLLSLAEAMRFDRIPIGTLERALLAFEAFFDAHEELKLEDLVRLLNEDVDGQETWA